MARASRSTAAQVLRFLAEVGWRVSRHAGSHAQLKHPRKRSLVTVPCHAGAILPPKTLASIFVQAGLPKGLRVAQPMASQAMSAWGPFGSEPSGNR